ncbi:hypothetical protein BDK51DRAFT_21797 [Blyttiomyces helicus]|uniref:t-SNARE coiled-coil homology domain-containing protein n=1 Tax=Blyttiomyces helicus TaxID=388810 RepID=A0A4V1IRI6_9FUNG|nr:hypothetical protein BDK51DRAFT_21797 [Blyttiomyces helicus]|eukprot:RKO90187.1 hypothetical protein BDK51DRAFT_21797 [Blyttiomyces helicus]
MSWRKRSEPVATAYATPAPATPSRWEAAAQAAETGQQRTYKSWETVDDEPEDFDNSDWLDRKTKKVQNDSLMSTRRALQKMNDTEKTAERNLEKMNSQTEQLYKIENRLQGAEQHVKVSDAKADQLKTLNRFFLIPSWGSGKTKRREEAARREAEERELIEQERREQEAERASRSARTAGFRGAGGHPPRGSSSSYSTPQGIDRDDTENEIDSNVDQLSAGLARLKMMGQTMNSELESQTLQVGRITDRTDRTGERLNNTNTKLNRIMK